MMKIYETIRILRQNKGYSQEYVAEVLSIDAVSYGRIERGVTKLTVERLAEIAGILGYTPVKLFELSNDLEEENGGFRNIEALLRYNITLSEKILARFDRM